MCYDDSFLDKKLNERIASNGLRSLTLKQNLIDFCSNDYLGIATGRLLQAYFTGTESHGSKGARTLAGNHALAEETEHLIAGFHEAESALLFNSGYAANTGLISAVAGRGDLIYYDSLVHASLRDGIRLSFADAFSFRHNDLTDLEEKLRNRPIKPGQQTFVVTESVFSMDGDEAPLQQLVEHCEIQGAHLILDEAHAIGVLGERGEGAAQHAGLHQRVFARVYTYGKGPGAHGAAITGTRTLISYLINFARPFVYTTALPESAVRAIQASYKVFPAMQKEREQIQRLISFFRHQDWPVTALDSRTPIQGLVIPGNDQVLAAAARLEAHGLDIRPIRYPSVPKEKERLRVSLHAFNTTEEIETLHGALCQRAD